MIIAVNDQTVTQPGGNHDHNGHHDHHQHGHVPYINLASIPPPNPGHAEYRVRQTNPPLRETPGGGAVRTFCTRSHFNFDDSLVHPGRPAATHLHMYFGNTAADANLTPDNILSEGNSTCLGGIANRSAYWVPAVIDTSDGAVMDMSLAHVYYKNGFNGVRPEEVQPIPPGIAIIVGDMNRTTPWEWGPVDFRCNGRTGKHIPADCVGEMSIHMDFPQCWDGVNLYTTDQSHMAFARRPNGCPASHPVALPAISYTIIFPIPEGRNTANWRLSSDNYEGAPGGYSMHADWINGWAPELPPIWTREVINLSLDGGSGMIGGGNIIY